MSKRFFFFAHKDIILYESLKRQNYFASLLAFESSNSSVMLKPGWQKVTNI